MATQTLTNLLRKPQLLVSRKFIKGSQDGFTIKR